MFWDQRSVCFGMLPEKRLKKCMSVIQPSSQDSITCSQIVSSPVSTRSVRISGTTPSLPLLSKVDGTWLWTFAQLPFCQFCLVIRCPSKHASAEKVDAVLLVVVSLVKILKILKLKLLTRVLPTSSLCLSHLLHQNHTLERLIEWHPSNPPHKAAVPPPRSARHTSAPWRSGGIWQPIDVHTTHLRPIVNQQLHIFQQSLCRGDSHDSHDSLTFLSLSQEC